MTFEKTDTLDTKYGWKALDILKVIQGTDSNHHDSVTLKSDWMLNIL